MVLHKLVCRNKSVNRNEEIKIHTLCMHFHKYGSRNILCHEGSEQGIHRADERRRHDQGREAGEGYSSTSGTRVETHPQGFFRATNAYRVVPALI